MADFIVRNGMTINTNGDEARQSVYQGSPEGFVVGVIGDVVFDITNGAFYQKQSGAGNTGWTKMATSLDIAAAQTGLDPKNSSRVATTGALAATYSGITKKFVATAPGAISIDGVSLNLGDQVLVKDELTTGLVPFNGLYIVTVVGNGVTPYELTRAGNFNTSAQVTQGAYTFVVQGATNAYKGFVLTTPDPITLDTTDLVWTLFSSAPSNYIAGNGITIASNTISVQLASNGGLTFSGTGLEVKVDTTNNSTGLSATGEVIVNGYARFTGTGVNPTTTVILDTVPVALFKTAMWKVSLVSGIASTNKYTSTIDATTDGTIVDSNEYGIIYLPSSPKTFYKDINLSVDISGTNMRLKLTTTTNANINYAITRIAEA